MQIASVETEMSSFTEKNKKRIISLLLSAEIAQKVLSINLQQMTFRFSFFPRRVWRFMQIASNRDSLYEISNSVFWKEIRKVSTICCLLKLPREF